MFAKPHAIVASHYFHISVMSPSTNTAPVIREQAHGQRANNDTVSEGQRLMHVIQRIRAEI